MLFQASTKLVLKHMQTETSMSQCFMLTHAMTMTHTDSSRPHTETDTNSCRMFSVPHMQHVLFISTTVTQIRQLIQTLKHTNRLHKSQRNLQILPLSGRTKQNVLAWKKGNFFILKHDKIDSYKLKNWLYRFTVFIGLTVSCWRYPAQSC